MLVESKNRQNGIWFLCAKRVQALRINEVFELGKGWNESS